LLNFNYLRKHAEKFRQLLNEMHVLEDRWLPDERYRLEICLLRGC